MGAVRFGVPEHLVLWFRDALGYKVFVETGTNRAATAVWASGHFDRVVTIEGADALYRAAVAAHGRLGNVRFVNGDSRTALGPVLAELTEPAVIWLDAHWCAPGTFGQAAECPVLDEVRVVNESPRDHVVLVDDARYFLAPPPAPHRADDWPGLADLAVALNPPGRPRYLAVAEDVLIAAPAAVRERLVEYLRGISPPRPAGLFRRLVTAVRGG